MDIDDYREFVRWQLDLIVNHNAMFRHANPPFYFGEAVAVLRGLKARGMGTKKCIEVLGDMMGSVDYFRDFILENDPQGAYASVHGREVDQREVANARHQLMYKIWTSDSPYVWQMAGAVAEGNWNDGLLQLLAKLQVKLYYLHGAANKIAGLREEDMN